MKKAKGTPYVVRAEWDDEAAVWVASSEDVPGLVTGAATLEALVEKLRAIVPEMLELNGVLSAKAAACARFKLIAERVEQVRAVA
jgi:predicted RNase H-like HicB family nuclease